VKEPVDHILRPQLPWRKDDSAITECGYDASKVKTLSRDEYFARAKEMGAQRCALFTCMTCADTARRWGSWDDDPRKALERAINWECGWGYTRDNRGDRLKHELLAIADLIDLHLQEFHHLVLASESRQEWLARKAERSRKAAIQHPRTTL
jgi:hypothetical protein